MAILSAEAQATDEFSKEGLAFQRLALPSMLDAVNRLIPKWGKFRTMEALPGFVAPMVVSLISQLLQYLPREHRQRFVDIFAEAMDAQLRVACARAFAAFDGADAEIMARAEWDRLKTAREARYGR
jgi:hypothetical protein